MLWILYSKKLIDKPWIYHGMIHAAEKIGIDYEFYFYEDFSIQEKDGVEKLFYEDKEINRLPDIALLRGRSVPLQEFFKKNHIRMINRDDTISLLRDKYQTYLEIQKITPAIPQPLTLYGPLSYEEIVEKLGSPFVVKDNFGMKGNCVFLLSSKKDFEKVKAENSDITFIYQKYISSSFGKDIRVYVIGNSPVGAMMRKNDNDFRSNISLGAIYYPITFDEELMSYSKAIQQATNLEFGSIDFLFGENGYYFCEANTNAGFDGFKRTGIICQELLMEYIKTL